MTFGDFGADIGPVLIGPGRLDQLGSEVGVAGLVMWPLWVLDPVEYSVGTKPTNPMNEAVRPNRRQSQTSACRQRAPIGGHAAVGRQPVNGLIEWSFCRTNTSDRPRPRQVGITGQDHGPVVVEGGLEGWLLEAKGGEPALVLHRPVRPTPPHPRVLKKELGQPIPDSGEIFDHAAPGPAQVTNRLSRGAGMWMAASSRPDAAWRDGYSHGHRS